MNYATFSFRPFLQRNTMFWKGAAVNHPRKPIHLSQATQERIYMALCVAVFLGAAWCMTHQDGAQQVCKVLFYGLGLVIATYAVAGLMIAVGFTLGFIERHLAAFAAGTAFFAACILAAYLTVSDPAAFIAALCIVVALIVYFVGIKGILDRRPTFLEVAQAAMKGELD